MSDSEHEDEITDLSDPSVTTMYQTAAAIANKAIQAVIDACIPGADICMLCELGDSIILKETGEVYNKKDKKGDKIQKGIAFPTCVTPNELLNHFSPMKDESRLLKEGDIAKIDLAAHIDGFIAAVAHTVVVGKDVCVEGKSADVVQAAWNAAEAALRKIKVGGNASEVTGVIESVASEYGVSPVDGVSSYEMSKFQFDGKKTFPNKISSKFQDFQFSVNEVYCVDVMFSSIENSENAKPKETEIRTTVFKRSHENTYIVKTQKGREFLSEIQTKAPVLAFSLRQFSDPLTARAGSAEARRHRLVEEFPVLRGKEETSVHAHFKFTVLLLPGGTRRITGLAFSQHGNFKSEKFIKNEELKNLIASSANPKKQKKKAKEAEKQ